MVPSGVIGALMVQRTIACRGGQVAIHALPE